MTRIEGRGLLLLSGGFDSPVAGHMMKGQGLDVSAVHFSYEPVLDDASVRKARALAGHLGLDALYVVRIGDALKQIVKHCRHKLYFVLSKRLMMRLASAIAKDRVFDYLITGESLGQVSSQTLPNLAVINRAATVPVLRPLIGFDKQEIIDRARQIGTYETSVGPELCDVLGPEHPSTQAKVEDVEREEDKLDLDALIRAALDGLAVVEVGAPAHAEVAG